MKGLNAISFGLFITNAVLAAISGNIHSCLGWTCAVLVTLKYFKEELC